MGSEADTDAYGGELDGLFAQLGDGTLKPPKVRLLCVSDAAWCREEEVAALTCERIVHDGGAFLQVTSSELSVATVHSMHTQLAAGVVKGKLTASVKHEE